MINIAGVQGLAIEETIMTANAICQTEGNAKSVHSHHFNAAAFRFQPFARLAPPSWITRDINRQGTPQSLLPRSNSLQGIRRPSLHAALGQRQSVRKLHKAELIRNQSVLKRRPKRILRKSPVRKDLRLHIDPSVLSRVALQCVKLSVPSRLA